MHELKNLRSIRRRAGRTQAQFADMVGVPQSTISNVERTPEMNMTRRTFSLIQVGMQRLEEELSDRAAKDAA